MSKWGEDFYLGYYGFGGDSLANIYGRIAGGHYKS